MRRTPTAEPGAPLALGHLPTIPERKGLGARSLSSPESRWLAHVTYPSRLTHKHLRRSLSAPGKENQPGARVPRHPGLSEPDGPSRPGLRPRWARRHSLLSALMRDFPSLMSSLMNLLVLSSSASCDLSVSRKCGLSRQQSLNSSAGSPMVPEAPSRGARLPGSPRGPQPRARTRRDPDWHPGRPPAPQVWPRLAFRATSAREHDSRTQPGPGCYGAVRSGRRAGSAAADQQRRREASELESECGSRLPASLAG